MHLPWHFHVCTYHQSEVISQSLWAFCKFGLVLREHSNRSQQNVFRWCSSYSTVLGEPSLPLHMQYHYQGVFLGIKISTWQKDLYTISMLRHVLVMVATYQLGKVYSLVWASHWLRGIKPGTDLCFECEQNVNVIFKSANLPEEEKSRQQKLTYLEPNRSVHTTMSHVLRQKPNVQNF